MNTVILKKQNTMQTQNKRIGTKKMQIHIKAS